MSRNPDERESALARRLRESIDKQGLSIRTVAAKVDISYEHVRKVVNGEVIPSKLVLKGICEALELPLDEMERLAKVEKVITRYGDVLSELTGKKPGLEPIEAVWGDLTPEHKKDLVGMAETWAERDRSKNKEAIQD